MVREKREEIQNGQEGDKRFENEGGGSEALAGGGRLYRGSIQVRGVQGGSHNVASGDMAGGQLQV